MKALEFPLSNNFFCVTKLDSTSDNTSHGRKSGFVTYMKLKYSTDLSSFKLQLLQLIQATEEAKSPNFRHIMRNKIKLHSIHIRMMQLYLRDPYAPKNW